MFFFLLRHIFSIQWGVFVQFCYIIFRFMKYKTLLSFSLTILSKSLINSYYIITEIWCEDWCNNTLTLKSDPNCFPRILCRSSDRHAFSWSACSVRRMAFGLLYLRWDSCWNNTLIKSQQTLPLSETSAKTEYIWTIWKGADTNWLERRRNTQEIVGRWEQVAYDTTYHPLITHLQCSTEFPPQTA